MSEPGVEPRSEGGRRAARRAGWGVADQALSSLTNFGLAVVLARGLTPEGFGAASVTFAVYVLALNVSRALSSEPLTVRHSHLDRDSWARAAADALGVALLLGALVAPALLVVAVLVGGNAGGALAALAIVLPLLLLQDAWRFAFFAAGRPRDAFLNDLAWLAFMVVAVGLVLVVGSAEPWPFVLAWGLAGALAGLVGVAQTRLMPAPQRTRAWFRSHRDLASRYAAEAIVLTGSSQLRLLLVGAIGGLAMAGALRAGQVILGAIHPLTYGIQLTAVPEAVATARRGPARLDRLVVTLGLGLGAASLAWGVVVWLVPAGLGEALFGATWDAARTAVPGLTIVAIASGLTAGAVVGLRALAAARHGLRARVASSAIGVAAAVIGALTRDVATCAIAIGLAVAIGAGIWWVSYARARRDAKLSGPSPTSPSDETRLEAEGLPAET